MVMNDLMGEVKDQGHIVQLYPTDAPLSFHTNRTNHSWDMSNEVFDLEKNISEICEDNLAKKKISNIIPLKSNQVMTLTRRI